MKHLLYIGNKLAQHGLNQTTIETLGPLLEQEGFAVTYASSRKKQWVRLADMLRSVWRNRTVDYVLIDTYSTSGFWYAFAVSQLCRILKIRYLPILHGGNLPQRLRHQPKICRMLFQNAYRNVVPSRYLLDSFQQSNINKLVYIPNSIEIGQYPFQLRNIIQPNLLWVRAFDSIYNPEMAVAVLNRVRRVFPKAILCMVGPDKDGSLATTKAFAKALQLEVRFTGKLSKKQWIGLSQDYSVFLNTTHFDNMPVSLIEAMALGLPVISTNVGGIPYLLEHNSTALLVPDADADAMAQAAIDLCQNSALAEKLSHNAHIRSEQLDWQHVRQLWKAVLS